MSEARSSEELRELLPWYVNGTLSRDERAAVERWLRQSPQAAADLASWRRLSAAVSGQKLGRPSSSVRRRVMARTARTQGAARTRRLRHAWVWGAALALAILVVLWSAIQPGIVLQWSVNDGPLTAFRVYRAPAGSADFDLLQELPAQPDAQRYTYVDARLWPTQTYVYRVEGVRQSGQTALSQSITASALQAFPGQLAILLTSLIAGCSAVALARRWRGPGLQRSMRPAI